MKCIILTALAAVAVAAPQYGYYPPPTQPPPTNPPHLYQTPHTTTEPTHLYQTPHTTTEPTHLYQTPHNGGPSFRTGEGQHVEVVKVLKDERTHEEDGSFTVDVEAENGIVYSEAGSPGEGGAIHTSGHYSYPAPDGSIIEIKFVADENGFQPQSDVLPVAPEFPHPIPQFVLDQIAKAAEEDAAAAQAAVRSAAEGPSHLYGTPTTTHVPPPNNFYSAPRHA